MLLPKKHAKLLGKQSNLYYFLSNVRFVINHGSLLRDTVINSMGIEFMATLLIGDTMSQAQRHIYPIATPKNDFIVSIR